MGEMEVVSHEIDDHIVQSHFYCEESVTFLRGGGSAAPYNDEFSRTSFSARFASFLEARVKRVEPILWSFGRSLVTWRE